MVPSNIPFVPAGRDVEVNVRAADRAGREYGAAVDVRIDDRRSSADGEAERGASRSNPPCRVPVPQRVVTVEEVARQNKRAVPPGPPKTHAAPHPQTGCHAERISAGGILERERSPSPVS